MLLDRNPPHLFPQLKLTSIKTRLVLLLHRHPLSPTLSVYLLVLSLLPLSSLLPVSTHREFS